MLPHPKLLLPQPPPLDLLAQLRSSPARQAVTAYLHEAVPELNTDGISNPPTPYSLYRQFAWTG
jgi:hypothetical protein